MLTGKGFENIRARALHYPNERLSNNFMLMIVVNTVNFFATSIAFSF